MPITGQEFDEGASVVKRDLGEVMNADSAYDTGEVADLIGRSWGIAKAALIAAQKEGKVDMKKIGRKHYFRFYPDGVPDFDPSIYDVPDIEE